MLSSIKSISSKTTSKLNTLLPTPTPNPNVSQTIISSRNKHSNRQIKRIFKQNPAFHRVSTRNATKPKKDISPPPPVTIEAIFNPTVVLPNGWSQPPLPGNDGDVDDIMKKREEIPFGVKRTGNKPNGAIGFLPVYSKSK